MINEYSEMENLSFLRKQGSKYLQFPYQTYRKREKKKFAKVLPLGNSILIGKAYG